MGIAKYLQTGKIHINATEKQIEIAEHALVLPYEKLKPQDWGYMKNMLDRHWKTKVLM